MRLKKDVEALQASGKLQFGYVDIEQFNCPPFVMFTNAGDCGICGFQLLGMKYEPQSTYAWSKLVVDATSIFDIGTRCGEYSLIAAALREDVPIISCEPNPDGFARLQVNMLANGVKNMKIRRVAVGATEGFAHFGWTSKFQGHISSGGRIVAGRFAAPPEQVMQLVVEVTRLDKLIEGLDAGPRPVMKIDVEGGELAVFEGMKDHLQKRPDIILETFLQDAADAINAMTKPLGYNYFFINEKERSLSQRAELRPVTTADNDQGLNHLLTTRSPDQVAAMLTP